MGGDLDPRRDFKEKRKKENLQIASIATVLAITIGGGIFTSCSKNEEVPKDSIVTKTELQNTINGDVNIDSIKTFEEGEHVLSVRVLYGETNNFVLTGYAVNNIPDGYEIFEITPCVSEFGYGSETVGYDIWFKNTETVEVHATYNEAFKQYGYYTFGTIVEDAKVLEK